MLGGPHHIGLESPKTKRDAECVEGERSGKGVNPFPSRLGSFGSPAESGAESQPQTIFGR